MTSRNYYIADTHFGHANAIGHDDRPFASIEEHDAVLISNWNSVVTDRDHVYVLGDFYYKGNRPVSYYTTRLNGSIHLLRGNHDKRSEKYEGCFCTVNDILEVPDYIGDQKVRVVLSHYWMPFYSRRKIMLYGHTHRSRDYRLEEMLKEKLAVEDYPQNAYNVGAMFQDYFPRRIEEIVRRD